MCCDLGDETDSLRQFIKIHPSIIPDAAVTRDRPKSKTKVDICLFTFGVCHSFSYTSLIYRLMIATQWQTTIYLYTPVPQ